VFYFSHDIIVNDICIDGAKRTVLDFFVVFIVFLYYLTLVFTIYCIRILGNRYYNKCHHFARIPNYSHTKDYTKLLFLPIKKMI